MARITAAENEQRVLSFRRERLVDDVQVARVSLRRGESSLFHHHSRTRDTFYVLSGELTVTLRVPGDRAMPAFHAATTRPPHSWEDGAGRPVVRATLVCGDVFIVEPNVVHCAANLQERPCEFLCIEGPGEYDFILEDGD